MYIGIEARMTRVNGKTYWRIAPVVIGTAKQRMYAGAAVAVIAFLLSLWMLGAAKDTATQQPPQPTTSHYRGY